MRSLLLKDLVVAKWFWVGSIPIYLAQLVAMSDVPPAFLLLTLVGSGFFAFVSVGVEEAQGTEVLWNSLPVSRGQIVVARYLAVVLGIAFGLGVSWLVAQTAPAWISSRVPEPTLGLGAYASLAFVLLMLAALYLPCYFRFGAGRGLQVFSGLAVGLLLVLSIGGSLLVLVTGGTTSIAQMGPPTEEQLASIERWLDAWGGVLSAGLSVLALVGVTWSATISVQFHRVRDF